MGRGAARVRGRPRRRDRRSSRRARRVARRAGRTDDPRLRPLRRAAARRRGRVGDAAVRAERPRRPHLRPRRDRRQGADAGAAQGRRGVPRADTARCRSTSASCSRARRRSAARASPVSSREHRDELAADLVLSADGAMWRSSEPSIAIAAKGLVALDLVVTGPARRPALGPPRRRRPESAARAGARSSPACTTPTAPSPWPASTTTSLPLSAADRAALARVPFDEEAYHAEVGVPALHGEPGFTTLERLWTRPTLEVNGVEGGGRFTVIPRRARAHITCRLVPDQEPAAVFDAVAAPRTQRIARPGVEVAVECPPGACRPTRSRPTTRPSGAATSALRTVYPDRETLLVRIGGTLPAASLFERGSGPEDAAFLVLDGRRAASRAERVLPAQPPRRGDAGVGRALAAAGDWTRARPVWDSHPRTAVRSRRSPLSKESPVHSRRRAFAFLVDGGRRRRHRYRRGARRGNEPTARARPRRSAAAASRSRASRTRSRSTRRTSSRTSRSGSPSRSTSRSTSPVTTARR